MDVPPFFGMWMNTGPGLVPSSESSISPRAGSTRPRHRDDAQDRDRARGGERRAKDPRRAPGPFGPRRPRSGAIAPPGGSRQEGRALAPVAHRAYGAPRRRAIRLEHHGAAAAEANTLQSRAGCYYECMRWHGAGECSCEILHAQPVTNFRGCIAAFEVRLDRGRVWDASRSGFNSRFQLQRGERTSRRPEGSRIAHFMRACTVRGPKVS